VPVDLELEDVGEIAQVQVELVEILRGGGGDDGLAVEPVADRVVVERKVVVRDVIAAVAGVREQLVPEARAAGRVPLGRRGRGDDEH
jgi:hypothetical protein